MVLGSDRKSRLHGVKMLEFVPYSNESALLICKFAKNERGFVQAERTGRGRLLIPERPPRLGEIAIVEKIKETDRSVVVRVHAYEKDLRWGWTWEKGNEGGMPMPALVDFPGRGPDWLNAGVSAGGLADYSKRGEDALCPIGGDLTYVLAPPESVLRELFELPEWKAYKRRYRISNQLQGMSPRQRRETFGPPVSVERDTVVYDIGEGQEATVYDRRLVERKLLSVDWSSEFPDRPSIEVRCTSDGVSEVWFYDLLPNGSDSDLEPEDHEKVLAWLRGQRHEASPKQQNKEVESLLANLKLRAEAERKEREAAEALAAERAEAERQAEQRRRERQVRLSLDAYVRRESFTFVSATGATMSQFQPYPKGANVVLDDVTPGWTITVQPTRDGVPSGSPVTMTASHPDVTIIR